MSTTRSRRIDNACEVLNSPHAKQLVIALSYLYPDCAIFWDEKERSVELTEADKFTVTVIDDPPQT
jgi:hypothetical protein